MSNLEVQLGKLKLKNPVILASGTFDRSITQKIDVNKLGGLVTKTITLNPREGNPIPHIIKTKYGWLNSVGIKNPGIKEYLKNELPFWQKFQTIIITSIGGETEKEYTELTTRLNDSNVKVIEVNVSCPNIDQGGMGFGTNAKTLFRLTSKIRKVYKNILIVKISPNVKDIVTIAKSTLDAGADIVSLTNTYLALEIDNKKKRPLLFRKVGGYSGGAIKPISLRMVWEVYNKLRCPIIGGGGIEDFSDALDYIMVGATAISIGSGIYLNPKLPLQIISDFEKYLKKNKLKNFQKIKGIIK